jgi:uncharacterized membrane protein YgaE (UPF0421/DUF939 family)
MTAHRVQHTAIRTADRSGSRTAPPRGRWQAWQAWLDWLAGTDPGLMRLQLAGEVLISIGIVLAVEWAFVRVTGALQRPVPAGAPAALAAQLGAVNHDLTVIAMVLGAITAMIGGFGASIFSNARGQLVTYLFIPLPMIATLALGLSLHVRVLSLASLAVVVAIGTYCRRFGPRGFISGALGFMGAFLGFFLQKLVSLPGIGWLAAEIVLGIAVSIVVHFTLFNPHPGVALRRVQRSYAARARDVASDVADLFGAFTGSADPDRHRRAEKKLQRQLLRLNEAALLIESRLVNRLAIPDGWNAAALHQQVFDSELALNNVARFAVALARRQLPEPVNELIGQALAQVRDADHADALASAGTLQELLSRSSALTAKDRILLHRFAASVAGYSNALRAWLQPDRQVADDKHGDFQTQVLTFGPWLPGSAFISRAASLESGTGLAERIRLAPYSRVAIQVGVAVGGAIVAGDALSGRRFYWAVIAAFITFMGTNTAGEQLRKGLFRVVGTLIGVIAGSALAHLVGDRVGLQIAVVLVALFLGFYLFRISYTFMTIAITVMVSQLYVDLNEFSNSLLLLRLEETAVGAAVAMVTVLLVLPLHVGRVARVAARQHLEALADLIDRCLDRLLDPASDTGSDLELRAAARRLDNTYQALIATVWPTRTPLLGRLAQRSSGFLESALAARNYTRSLILDASLTRGDLGPAAADELSRARRQLADSVAGVTAALRPDGAAGQYVRSASLFARVADALPEQRVASRPQHALRDLQLLDGTLAEAARWAGVPVTDLDTALRPGRAA